MASILDLVKHYQHAIEKYPNDEQKILKSIDKLFNLGVTVQHLQETGVGRTVNALRKEPGDVGKAARALVYKWKLMVAAEESDHEEEHIQPTPYNGHENGKNPEDSDYEGRHKHNQYDKLDRVEEIEKSYSNSKYVNGDYSGGKRKHQSSEEEEPYIKKSRHINQNETPEKVSHAALKKDQSETEPDSASSHSDEEGDSDSRNSESCDEKSSKEKSRIQHKRSSSPKQSISHDKHKHESSSSGRSHKHVEKQSKHSNSESKHVSDKSSKDHKSSSSDKHRKEKESSSQKKENIILKSDEKEKKKKESREESSSRHKSSSEKHKSSNNSDKSKSHSEKSSNKPEKHSSSSHKEKNEKDKHKHLSEKSSDKHKSKEREHSSSKEKHHVSSKEKSKDKNSSSKDKEHSHKSDKKHSSASDTSEKDNLSKSKSDKSDEQKRSSDSKEKKSSSKSSHSSKSSKSSSSKSKDIPKKKTQKENCEDGIDCGSGASFAEALGMISPSKPKKKSSSKETSFSPNNTTSNDNLTPAALLAPNAQLAPLPALEISALPEISPNYKPRPPPKFLPHFTEEDAISAGISSKNQRTKVYSGNKVLGKIPTLYEMCVQILQEHIDALEYTGGVPYEILKPIVDKATPQQLYMLEHFNPYLMEETDHLWQKFCEKSFRNKKRQELESWREMFIRCQEEQENRLKSLTTNIKRAQEAKKAPIKQTKMAYVDTIVKPPRSVARKQAQHGTAFAASASPAARVAALAAAPNVLKGSARPAPVTTTPSTTFQKPKKAPLMQKALQFMRGRKR